MQVFAGVDVGGTGVKVGVVTSEGRVLAREQQNYHPDKHEPQDVVDLAALVLHEVLKTVRRPQQSGMPDAVLHIVATNSQAGGVIHAAANFPSWKDVPLQQLFTDTLGMPVRSRLDLERKSAWETHIWDVLYRLMHRKVTVCNDADAAILAEQWVGTAKGGVKDFIMLSTPLSGFKGLLFVLLCMF
ncbi:hypothetical protein BBJ28_00014537 [Nothophytophthora sp. Chile5]|nr:hypothetical protein BBJ28_00014537 [Nothophytophthora sp. Chile5]